MAKQRMRPGLPEGFDIDIPNDGPVSLGDYFDETSNLALDNSRFDEPKIVEEAKAEKIVELSLPQAETPKVFEAKEAEPVRAEPTQRAIIKEFPAPKPQAEVENPQIAASKKKRPFFPRMEITLSPNSQKMVSEIVEHVQQYSVQDDARTSEVFQALVDILHQALPELELGKIQRRGKWGSPTAEAFRFALGESFAEAIAKAYQKEKEAN